jgi:hypothetical protein
MRCASAAKRRMNLRRQLLQWDGPVARAAPRRAAQRARRTERRGRRGRSPAGTRWFAHSRLVGAEPLVPFSCGEVAADHAAPGALRAALGTWRAQRGCRPQRRTVVLGLDQSGSTSGRIITCTHRGYVKTASHARSGAPRARGRGRGRAGRHLDPDGVRALHDRRDLLLGRAHAQPRVDGAGGVHRPLVPAACEQRAACSVQRAACSVQRAACSVQRAARRARRAAAHQQNVSAMKLAPVCADREASEAAASEELNLGADHSPLMKFSPFCRADSAAPKPVRACVR